MKNEELIKSAQEELQKIYEDERKDEAKIEEYEKNYFEDYGEEILHDEIIKELRFEETCYYPELIELTRSTVRNALENYLSETKFAKHNRNKAFEVGVRTARMHKKEIEREIEKAQNALNKLNYYIELCNKFRDK